MTAVIIEIDDLSLSLAYEKHPYVIRHWTNVKYKTVAVLNTKVYSLQEN